MPLLIPTTSELRNMVSSRSNYMGIPVMQKGMRKIFAILSQFTGLLEMHITRGFIAMELCGSEILSRRTYRVSEFLPMDTLQKCSSRSVLGLWTHMLDLYWRD